MNEPVRKDPAEDVIQAAGGLVWRETPTGHEVLLVHRPRYDDWSFPKGKMEAGETWIATAVREVEEETGCRVTLDSFAGSFSYLVRQRVKVVLFWNMLLHHDTPFVPNEEVDEVRWLGIQAALQTLDYEIERDLLRAIAAVRFPQAT